MVLFDEQTDSTETLVDEQSNIVHVQYDYKGQSNDELTLRRGFRVEVLSKDQRISGSEGWWVGKVVGSTSVGIFPSDLVAKSEPNLRFIDEDALQIGEVIGFGGFGQVQRGTFGDFQIALKSAKSLSTFSFNNVNSNSNENQNSAEGDKKKLIEGILREARLFANLNHQNIIQLYGVCSSIKMKNLYLVLEFAHGGSLNKLLEKRKCGLLPAVFINYARQIADGMKYLHEEAPEHIIHRDLKSSNILVLEKINDVHDDSELLDKTLKITDFGLAKIQYQSITKSSAGTYAWMSPESIRDGQYSPKSDVWSYGVLLWELLTGEIPYHKLEQLMVVYGIGTGTYSLPIPIGCPEEFSSLIKACWKRAPEERATFVQLIEQIEKISTNGTFENFSQNTMINSASYHSVQSQWQNQIKAVYETFKDLAQQIEEKQKFLTERETEQDKEREKLLKWEQQLHEHELKLLERELKLTLCPTAQEKQNHGPKIQKRSGIKFMQMLLSRSLMNPSNYATNSSNIIIGRPENFQHLINFRVGLVQPQDSTRNSTTTGNSLRQNRNSSSEIEKLQAFGTINADTKSGLDFMRNFDVSSSGKNERKSNESSATTRPKTLAATGCRKKKTRDWLRGQEKARTMESTRKSKNSEAKWYLETKTLPSPSTTPTSTKSTPGLDYNRTGSVSGFSSEISLNSTSNDRSLANGILRVTNILSAVALGQSMPTTNNDSTSSRKNSEISQKPRLNQMKNEIGCQSLPYSAKSSSPIRKQHKRTSSSPLENIPVPNEISVNLGFRARPSYTPIRAETLAFPLIPPPPPSRPAHISQSDSQLLSNFRNDSSNLISSSEQIGHNPISGPISRIYYSPSTNGLWKSEEQLRFPSLLDIDSDEQKLHPIKALPPKINGTTTQISLRALERELINVKSSSA